MRRLIRPALFTVASVAAVVGFLAAGRMSPAPLAWSDIGGWLDRAEPVDAFSEMARWVGLVLAAYVAVVSFAALMAESASLVHMPRVHRWLSRLVGAVALPALRHRLLEATAVATITASSLQGASVGAVDTVMPTAALVVDHAPTAPDVERGVPRIRSTAHGGAGRRRPRRRTRCAPGTRSGTSSANTTDGPTVRWLTRLPLRTRRSSIPI